MDAISWVCEFVSHWSKAIEDNSGKIQIVIALGAIWLAYKAYKKVIEQIEISNEQTKLSIKQTKLATEQTKESIKQTKESVAQTKHFAKQVEEVAKQTEYAADQTKESVKQTKIANEQSINVIKQMNLLSQQLILSKQQAEFTVQQRDIDLTVTMVNLVNENLRMNFNFSDQAEKVVSKLKKILPKLKEKSDDKNYEAVLSIKGKIEGQIKTTEGTIEKLKNLSQKITKMDSLEDAKKTQEIINEMSTSLTSAISSYGEYVLAIYDIARIKEQTGLE